ncbi:MAG: hypothetical protein ACHQEA_14050 [Gaiellales bacterium]
MTRGVVTGAATFVGGSFHSLPFLISDVNVALAVAGVVVAAELIAIAFVRRAYMRVSLSASLVQVTLGGSLVALVGVAVGHA